MIHQQTQLLMQRTRLNYFEHNEKIGKFLTNQLKRNKEESLIKAIQDTQGNLMYNPKEINTSFCNYYQPLYRSDNVTNISNIHSLLNNIELPKLTKEQATIIDRPLNSEELRKAIDSMPNNKSPGSDGYPI